MSEGTPFDPSSTPPEGAPAGPPGPDVSSKVSGPAIALIVVGALNVVTSLYYIAQGAIVLAMPAEEMRQQMEQQDPQLQQELPFDPMALMQGTGVGMIVVFVLALILSGVIIWGGIKMKNLQSRGLAMTASVLAMIPCLSPCCIVGLPIGIWALVVLNDPNVKDAFG